MKVLVINCGSSSIKYRLFDVKTEECVAEGSIAGLGGETSSFKHKTKCSQINKSFSALDYDRGFEVITEFLVHPEHGALEGLSEVVAVGHRTVHGGDNFTESVLIDQEVIAKMEQCIPLAPIHNPANLTGIKQAQKLLPGIPHVAVFDTAFHQTIPERAFMYALPYEMYEKHRIRKYGFHGSSCQYTAREAIRFLDLEKEKTKMVICHLGNGVTVAAVDGGKSVDTSLGFTPLEGLMMGTRCGDLDPGVILYMQRELGLDIDCIDHILNHQSGLLGISGVCNDMRVIVDMAYSGHKRCQLALEMFTYRVRKYIGAYAAVMGGLDVLVFTGGIGENSPTVRSLILHGMEFIGISLDQEINLQCSGLNRVISRAGSHLKVVVIPTNEELMIARETMRMCGLSPNSDMMPAPNG